MNSMRRRGVLAMGVTLLSVGLIRSAIPEKLPREREVRPDDAGVARTKDVTIEIVGLDTASSIRLAGGFSDVEFTASPGAILLLGRFALTAHGGRFSVQTQLRTADGFSYESLSVIGFPRVGVADVGTTMTSTYIYEVPKDKVTGDIAIHGSRPDGLQPIHSVALYKVPDNLDLEPGEASIPAVETVAAR